MQPVEGGASDPESGCGVVKTTAQRNEKGKGKGNVTGVGTEKMSKTTRETGVGTEVEVQVEASPEEERAKRVQNREAPRKVGGKETITTGGQVQSCAAARTNVKTSRK